MLKKPGISILIGSIAVPVTCLIAVICNILFFSIGAKAVFASEELQVNPASITAPTIIKPAKELILQEQDAEGRISVDFRDADINDVLRILSVKSGVNIVATKDVYGSVTIKLDDVSWYEALKTILRTYDLGYERQGNIITVTSMEKLTQQKEAEMKLSEIQPVVTEVFTLKYLDAEDVKDTLQPQLSSRGTITVLKMTAESGWQFSSGARGENLVKSTKEDKPKSARSKTLIVSEIPAYLEKIKKVIKELDVLPQQILIEARIMEVSEDALRDIGFDWGTGSTGAESSSITSVSAGKNKSGNAVFSIGGHSLGSEVEPSGFSPKAGTDFSGVEPYNAGLELLFKKLSGTQFEVILHALEEDARANTLSAPRIMTLNNQEATIMIGTKYPILKKEYTVTSSGASTVSGENLDYYQDIGIQLNVVPQISDDKYINMVVHPSVTSYTSTIGTNSYPVIETREAETRILIKDNQTVVIGGLLKDVKKKTVTGIPFLKDIPLLGVLFSRDTNDTEKIDLLIFITARIIRPGEGYLRMSEEFGKSHQIELEIIRDRLQQKKL